MFVGILALTAFVIAGVAAYFSVQGIATLYAGAFISVLVMAGALEVGKLVATSFLYRYWHKTNLLLKTYILVAILTLMGITSMGIFGFLTSAYQTSLIEYSQAETQQEFLVSQKAILEKELASLTMRVDTLNQSRLSQEQRLPSMSRRSAAPVYEDIKKSGEEITQARTRMNQIFEEIKTLDIQTLEAQKQSGKQKDIGTLKYAAELFGTDINTIVKWFTLAIIVVFDPLAIALVLAYNIAANRKFDDEEYEEEVVEEKTPIKTIKKFFNGKAKYRN
jgi:uncharacterized protein YpmB